MKRWLFLGALVLLAACSGDVDPATLETSPPDDPATTSSTPAAQTTSLPPTTTRPAPLSTTSSSTTTATTPAVAVSAPGEYAAESLEVRIRFESQVDGVSSTQLARQATAILNDPLGWSQSGFTFVADDGSELTVVLAEGAVVDELCLPLTTYGTVSCQNGPIVALNADRWRLGGDDWDGTVEEYRTYLINHEVGHLVGLRHPIDRCPTASKVSALMEPQTNNLDGCVGNGVPLLWEIEWARSRPAMVGPDPEWDGPQPSWPTDSEE